MMLELQVNGASTGISSFCSHMIQEYLYPRENASHKENNCHQKLWEQCLEISDHSDHDISLIVLLVITRMWKKILDYLQTGSLVRFTRFSTVRTRSRAGCQEFYSNSILAA